jgi:hypothetical protein
MQKLNSQPRQKKDTPNYSIVNKFSKFIIYKQITLWKLQQLKYHILEKKDHNYNYDLNLLLGNIATSTLDYKKCLLQESLKSKKTTLMKNKHTT